MQLDFFLKVHGIWMRDNKHKGHGKFLLGIKEIFFSGRMVKCWNKLFREVVKYPPLNAVKILLDRLWAWYNLTLLWSRGNRPNEHHKSLSTILIYDLLLLLLLLCCYCFVTFTCNNCDFQFCCYIKMVYFTPRKIFAWIEPVYE